MYYTGGNPRNVRDMEAEYYLKKLKAIKDAMNELDEELTNDCDFMAPQKFMYYFLGGKIEVQIAIDTLNYWKVA